MPRLLLYTLPILLAASASSALAAEADASADKGAKLHQQHCVSCHGSLTGGKPDTIYTRSDRRVTTLAGLRKQVQRCELSLGLSWFDEDVDAVTGYLNESFYRLPK
jgi:cytochrome c553